MGDFSDDQLLDDDTKYEKKESNVQEIDYYVGFSQMQLARAHWIQLHKTNMQVNI